MSTTNLKPTMSSGRRLSWMVAVVFILLLIGQSQLGFGQTSQPKTFTSPAEASTALFQAVQSEDEQAVEAILGAGREVTSSSDEVEDKLEREQFSQKYQEMHRLVREPDGSTVLYIGAENWPFPIPLVSRNGAWHFDSDTGKQEILFRTIGENEATAIEVCDAFEMAKKQGGTKESGDDPIAGYAQSLVSISTAKAGKTADATPEKEPSLFQGYYFRTEKNNGRVALVAYPAKYRLSGVMTFVLTREGVIYEKDLGLNTARVAPDLKQHSPDSSWHAAK